jgi:hypothetical protein
MKYKIIALLFIALFSKCATAQNYNAEIRAAAVDILDSMTDMQKKRVSYDMKDSARIKWNNLPVGLRARAGVHIGSMSENQRIQLHRLLSVSLSSQGYLKATGIFHLDNLLNLMYDSLKARGKLDEKTYEMIRNLQWSHQNFYLAFFGDPRDDGIWGFKLEGHHLSLNFSFVQNSLSITPFFIGTDPAEYRILDYSGWRVLGQEEDLGIKLVNSLSPELKKKATMSGEVPGDIITAAESGKRLINYWGVKGNEMTEEQRKLMGLIIREYVFNFEWEKANTEYDKIIKAGINNVYFGWIGSYKEIDSHYYLLNGPTFLIEFDNRGNHIHSIWREKGNEYGEDVLKKHYQSTQHK